MDEGDEIYIALTVLLIIFFIWKCVCASESGKEQNTNRSKLYPDLKNINNTILQNEGGGSMNAILDRFTSLEQVQQALRRAGLESCNLIFGIDYTKSNTWQGKNSHYSPNLHELSEVRPNPYQQVIQTIGETLSTFDDDGVIPAFGFGDITSKDQTVFPFRSDGCCDGFSDVLRCYGEITPHVRMSGPTSFAPLIYRAVDIVKQTKAYHILIIIADGQVTNETPTVDAIVYASNYPLSIIMIGVGDGPWDQMKEFDDRLPARRFDNFQFVDYHAVSRGRGRSGGSTDDAVFALHALMEIPDQYQMIRKLALMNFTAT